MITIKNLSKSYQLANETSEKMTILHDLNLTVGTGEVVAVVGSSGSGKSTLLGLVSGLDQPDHGEILIHNKSLQSLRGNDLTNFRASHIGVVFQQFHLVSHLTAYENVTLPLEILDKPFVKKDVEDILKQVGLGHRLDHKPTQLSGGESQRLALARALIIKPSLLLADEPSGSLDAETGEKVMNLFFEQIRLNNTTTMLVTHDMDLARRCDKIYKLHGGKLQAV
ncbi:ABC transporter ATP-binding protein [Bdellovibrio sp. qaytius]|nr:ABC transporter ATP-binding protein [Bdellovibrio sp. qaytius]